MKKIHYLDYCSYPWEKMVITANGDVCACCAGYKIGNIDFNNFDLNILDEIWNGEVAVKLRKNLINHTPDNFCLNCVTYKISENMEYLNVEDEYERKNNSEIVPYPIDLELHITEKCNATCPMCAWNVNKGNKRNREAKFININFLKLLANKYFSNLDLLNSSCSGELFLYDNLSEYLDLIIENKPKYVLLNTNGGFYLKDEIVEKLIKSHDIVYFSVDSLNKDIHDLIRGFDIKLVLNNIEKINRFNEQNNTKTDMGLKFVIMKMTLMKLVDSIKEAYENYGIKTFAFSHLCEYGLKGDSVLSDKYWRNLYNKQVDKLKKMQDEFGINLYSLEYCFDNEISINQTKRRGE